MCVQTMKFLANTYLQNSTGVTKYDSTHQLGGVMFQTWNDLGEAHIESGIDNRWRVNTPTYAGTTLTWTLTSQDITATFGPVMSTIHHFKIMFGDVPASKTT
jgi:hypothetical protein